MKKWLNYVGNNVFVEILIIKNGFMIMDVFHQCKSSEKSICNPTKALGTNRHHISRTVENHLSVFWKQSIKYHIYIETLKPSTYIQNWSETQYFILFLTSLKLNIYVMFNNFKEKLIWLKTNSYYNIFFLN